MGADPGSASAFGRWHAGIDDHLAGSGLDHTVLRPACFMQSHLWPVSTVRSDGRWYGMTGDGGDAAPLLGPVEQRSTTLRPS